MLRSGLTCCENSNTPFSSRSLEYNEEKNKICKVKENDKTPLSKNYAVALDTMRYHVNISH